ncbi:sulfite exporter TauE/SafE family protein [Bosea sp. BK604]|uniref:sulfite exporter TauE/SafE family protein n=1 Tax=Bosea sp. BK604 TaxID=2512180 RepID=UPI00104E18C5|nr:sulfite exporter TauE/SafE family protein [Bosea sp. BK604]TCR68690.1 sulfite exporter TauE/SafE [Bosea sp. BK604]
MLETILPAGISPAIALLLIGISFLTSAFTAAFGIGGGVAMLGALAGTVSPAMIIAVHGLVQVGSNVGRTYIQRAHAVWPLVLRFAIGSLVGVALGATFVVALPERLLLGVLGGFILLMTWVPKPELPGLASGGIVIGGAVSTFVTMFAGATGPFVQALLLPLKLDKRQLIATQAACTMVQHLLKVLAFGALGFAYADWLPLVAAMILFGFAGTMAGTKLLETLPERWFLVTIRTVLTVVGLDLLRRAAGLWS